MSVVEHLHSILRSWAQYTEPQKTFNMFFIEIDKKVIQKIPTEVQESQNSQHNPEQKEKFWRYHNT
jgi:hypothetical protein